MQVLFWLSSVCSFQSRRFARELPKPLKRAYRSPSKSRIIYDQKSIVYCNSATPTTDRHPISPLDSSVRLANARCGLAFLLPLNRAGSFDEFTHLNLLLELYSNRCSSTFPFVHRLTERVFRLYILRAAVCSSLFGLMCPFCGDASRAGLAFFSPGRKNSSHVQGSFYRKGPESSPYDQSD